MKLNCRLESGTRMEDANLKEAATAPAVRPLRMLYYRRRRDYSYRSNGDISGVIAIVTSPNHVCSHSAIGRGTNIASDTQSARRSCAS